MRAYSRDLRERIVRAVAEGQPMREAARRCGVGVNTVKRLVVLQERSSTLTPRPIPGRPRMLDDTDLRQCLEVATDATVLEHCAWWAETYRHEVSEAMMWRIGWTHTKNAHGKRTG